MPFNTFFIRRSEDIEPTSNIEINSSRELKIPLPSQILRTIDSFYLFKSKNNFVKAWDLSQIESKNELTIA